MQTIIFDDPSLAAYFNSRPVIFEIVFWGCMASSALILFTLGCLLISRLKFAFYHRRRKFAAAIWLPILRSGATNEVADAGPIKRSHREIVLEFWVDLRVSANAKSAAYLDQFAAEHNLEKTICAILKPNTFASLSRPTWLQNIALTGAQWMHSPAVLKFIQLKLESGNRYMAVNACACLVKIKAKGYEHALIKTLMRFPEEAPYVTSRMGAAGGSDVLHILKPFLGKLPKYAVMNFIALTEKSNDPSLLPIVEERLRITRNTEEIAALLRTIGNLGGTEQKSLIYPYLLHLQVPVKIQAVKSLGRVGDADDIEILIPELSAPNWWLRYRAAEAIILLSGKDESYIRDLTATLKDKFAADILRHAWSEQEWLLI